MSKKKVFCVGICMILLILLFISVVFATNNSISVSSASGELSYDAEVQEDAELDISQSTINDGEQIAVENIQKYKTTLISRMPNATPQEITNKLLLSIGYSQSEINSMSDHAKNNAVNSESITIQRSESSNNQGLNFIASYMFITLYLNQNNPDLTQNAGGLPVKYCLVNVLWSWDAPERHGASDYIGISFEEGKDYYQLMQLYPNSTLAPYEYCNFNYDKIEYNIDNITTYYDVEGESGQVVQQNISFGNRTFAMNLPEDKRNSLSPSGYDTRYENFSGETQFILQINHGDVTTVSQYVGVTYGHSTQEYEVSYSESTSVGIGISATITGPSLDVTLGTSYQWTYTPTTYITSTALALNVAFGSIDLVNDGVYNIVNQNSGRALELPAGSTQYGTPIRLATDVYSTTNNRTQNPFWQWRITYNSSSQNITIRPVLDTSKLIGIVDGNVVIAEPPSIAPLAIVNSSMRIQVFNYVIPQWNVQIADCYRIHCGDSFTSVLTYDNNTAYTPITYALDGATDGNASAWVFVEVPDEDIATETPKEVFEPNDVVYLKNVGTGTYLDVTNAAIANSVEMVTYAKGTNAYNQQFRLISQDMIKYWIEPQHTLDMKVDIPGGSINNGVKATMYVSNAGENQRFKFYPLKRNGSKIQYLIATGATNYQKVIQSDTTTSVTQETMNINSNYQLWEIEYIRKDDFEFSVNHTYSIRNKSSKFYFDVPEASTLLYKGLLQWKYGNATNQKFKISPFGDGSFVFRPQHTNNRVLEIENNSDNGNPLRIYSERNNLQYQRFKFRRASKDSFYILTGASNYNKIIAVSGDNAEGNALIQWDNLEYTTMQWVLEINDTLGGTTLNEGYVKPITINGTTAKTLYFTPNQSAGYYFETVGPHTTSIKIYVDTGTGTYVLKTATQTQTSGNNKRIYYYLSASYNVKLVISGAQGESGTTGVIAYKT